MPDRVDAAAARHRNIHDDNIRPHIFVALIGRRCIAGLAHDLESFLFRKERTVALANDGVVVHNKDSDCFPAHCRCSTGASNGIMAYSLKPLSPRSMTSNVPPSAVTRSRMPINPKPLP